MKSLKYSAKKKSNYTPKRISISASKLGENSRLKKSTNRKLFAKFGPTVGGANRSNASANNQSKHPRRAKILKFMKRFLIGSVIFGLIAAIGGFVALSMYLKNLQASLPDPNTLIERNANETTIIYDRNGVELYRLADEINREFVSINDISKEAKAALIAAEDADFYQHKGVDWVGLTRCTVLSGISNLTDGKYGGVCGASTLSQQLVRITIMTDVFGAEAFDREGFGAIRRKLREILLTYQVEKNYTKDQILQLYMNEVPMGGVQVGYKAASKTYFNKEPNQLTLDEGALLAGILPSPSTCAPVVGVDPECAPGRQKIVFDQIERHKDALGLTGEQVEEARKIETKYDYKPVDINRESAHWVFYVKSELEKEFGKEMVEYGGLRVYTTLDLEVQKIAQEEVTNGVAERGARYGSKNGAMVVIDPKNFQILSMVGSIGYDYVPADPNDRRVDPQQNVATSMRQMGSSVKPYIDYLPLIEKYGPYLVTPDIKEMSFPGWGAVKPQNYDNGYKGLQNMRQALEDSRNITAIYALQTVGVEAGINSAKRLGVTAYGDDPTQWGLSIALGAAETKLIENTLAYTVMASGGVKKPLTYYLKVTDSKGEVIKEFAETEGERAIKENDAYMLNWILCDLQGFNTTISTIRPFYFVNGQRVCVKTGTTDSSKDLVTMMYHKNLVVGVWSGNNDNTVIPGGFGSLVSQPIGKSFMERVASKYKPEGYARPAGIVSGTVCLETGRIPAADSKCTKIQSVWDSSRPPQTEKNEKVYVCKATKKVASNGEAANRYGLVDEVYIPNFQLENAGQRDAYNRYVYGKIFEQEINTLPAPEPCPLPLGPGGAPVVTITEPGTGTEYNVGQQVTVKTTTIAENSVAYVEFSLDGEPIQNGRDNSEPFEFTFTLPNSLSNGIHTLTAKVVDDQSRIGTASVPIVVKNPNVGNVNVTVTSPTSGQVVTALPHKLIANLTGSAAGTIVNVKFKIVKKSGLYNETFTDNSNGDGWSAMWTTSSPLAVNGNYVITAIANDGTKDYSSAPLEFVLQR